MEKVRKRSVASPICSHRELTTVSFGGISSHSFLENIQMCTGLVLWERQCFIISFSVNAMS